MNVPPLPSHCPRRGGRGVSASGDGAPASHDWKSRFEESYFEWATLPYFRIGTRLLLAAGYVKQVLADDELSREQREAIEAMTASDRAKARWLEKQIISAADAVVSGEYEGAETSAAEKQRRKQVLDAAIADRVALDWDLIRHIFSLLTPQQQARLPFPAQ